MVDVVEYPLKAIERITMERNRLAAEVERLTAQLEAARVVVAELPEYYHEASCGSGDCCCPAEYGETKRIAARRAVGLEG